MVGVGVEGDVEGVVGGDEEDDGGGGGAGGAFATVRLIALVGAAFGVNGSCLMTIPAEAPVVSTSVVWILSKPLELRILVADVIS